MKTTWTGANPQNTILLPQDRVMDSCHGIYTVWDLKQAYMSMSFFPLLVGVWFEVVEVLNLFSDAMNLLKVTAHTYRCSIRGYE